MPPSARQIYLPTEIIVQIVYFIATTTGGTRRQSTLHACCLISRQWYSVAVAFLYERPQLHVGLSFKRFTDTVCPPIRARKSKLNLGSLVRYLDLSLLVHHSTNSLTARLLGRVKENLEVFIAPKVSFSANSLPALSKCHNLRFLDLSLVGDPIPITNLEKALRNLKKLVTLHLPYHSLDCPFTKTEASTTANSMNWPASLQKIQVIGAFSESDLSTVSWPPNLTTMTLTDCEDLSFDSLGTLLSSPHLGTTLKRLTITDTCDGLTPECLNLIPAYLPELEFLNVPVDLVHDPFFDILAYMTPPWALKTLELGDDYKVPVLNFTMDSLLGALHGGLAKLRALGASNEVLNAQPLFDNDQIDSILLERHDNESEIEEVDDDGLIGVGIYSY